jgi:hypothetical protein
VCKPSRTNAAHFQRCTCLWHDIQMSASHVHCFRASGQAVDAFENTMAKGQRMDMAEDVGARVSTAADKPKKPTRCTFRLALGDDDLGADCFDARVLKSCFSACLLRYSLDPHQSPKMYRYYCCCCCPAPTSSRSVSAAHDSHHCYCHYSLPMPFP